MSDETTPPKEVLDKEVRLRCTVEQKAFMDAAAKDAGYRTLSDFVRPLLWDRNILVVDGEAEVMFTVIPAFTADDAQRAEAKKAIDGMLELARLMAEQPVPAEEPFPVIDPAEVPIVLAPGDLSIDAPPRVYEEFGLHTRAAAVAEEFATPVRAGQEPPPVENFTETWPVPPELQSPPPTVPLAVVGPAPQPEENSAMFIARRVEEIKLAGQTPLAAQMTAEAEWRAAHVPVAEPAPVAYDPLAVPQRPVQIPQDGRPYEPPPVNRGFCAQCGNALQGTPFCAGCGTPV